MKAFGGIVLAGGKSSRMGEDKSFLQFEGKLLIEHSIDLLKAFTPSIFISANNKDYDRFNYPVIFDEIRNCGPIGGLHSTLKQSDNDWNMVISCDTPFLSNKLVERVISNIGNFDCIVPNHNGWNEPLVAFYNKSALEVIERLIGEGVFKLNYLIKQLNCNLVDVSDLLQEDPNLFKNFNSPMDMAD